MSKPAKASICTGDLKALLLSTLAEHGVSAVEADRLTDRQVAKVWKRYGGAQPYFRLDHPGKVTNEHRRKGIYMEWWANRPEGEALQHFLENWNIGERRLQQIQAEGRKKKWAA